MDVSLTRRTFAALAGGLALSLRLFVRNGLAQTQAAVQSPDERARVTEQQMTDDERLSMLYSLMVNIFGTGTRELRVPADIAGVAGYVQGVPRLGVPPLLLGDASLGLSNTGPTDRSTALPAGLALGATFNPDLAHDAGVLVGREARAKGYNVALGAGINLVREVRNGRNFEYVSEDPLLSGLIGAEVVRGTQAQGVIALLKHVSLNASETNKFFLNAVIDPAAHRESDLLAFEIAIDRSQPGALMSAYNKVNGDYCSGNEVLLNDVVKGAFGFRGWIMSDWRAVYSWDYALKGLDQQSGAQMDEQEWFNEPLKAAYTDGKIPKARIADMVRRMLRSYYAIGIDQWGPTPAIDMEAHNATALDIARQGIVLLKNDGVLPIAPGKRKIAVIGGLAQIGVLSGDGSSQVMPPGGYAAVIPARSHPLLGPTTMRFFPSSPFAELKKQLPDATIDYDPGASVADAVALAKASDLVIINAIRHEGERFDNADLSLPYGQDALIDALVAANPNIVVVLQTGNPVAMPWRDRVKAIVQAWFPGQAGGQAIAEVLAGTVNPSGRLPITFPVDVSQTPHPALPGADIPLYVPFDVDYVEGAEVGYRWFAKINQKPLYAFGFGLGYTSFAYADLVLRSGDTVTAEFTVTNTGAREGADVPQIYLTEAPNDRRKRLLGFQRVSLKAGESRRITIVAEPRLLARYDAAAGKWRIADGVHRIVVGRSAVDSALNGETTLVARLFGA